MIIGIVIKLFTFVLNIAIWILPDWALPDLYLSSSHQIILYSQSLNDIFPVTDLLVVMTGLFAFELTIIIAKLTLGAISLLRGGGRVDVD